jgi:hypothetical protein
MVKVVVGNKGIGKTKHLLLEANEVLKTCKGDIVFLDKSSSLVTDLRHEIRYVNLSEFPFSCLSELFGFICGLIAEDYDITAVFMDGLGKYGDQAEKFKTFFENITKLETKFNIDFTFSYSGDVGLLPSDVVKENSH